MNQFRGILCLNEAPYQVLQKKKMQVQRLIFNENEPLLYQAQAALWDMRRQYSWVCVAAEGRYNAAALALAAQLPVDRLALMGGWTEAAGACRRFARLRNYALRNLSLVISDIMLVGAPEADIRRMIRGRRHGRLCVLPGQDWEECAGLIEAEWNALREKTCLIH